MNDFMASVGLVQLKKINKLNKRRNLILKKYLKGIKNLKFITPTYPYFLQKGSYWLFSINTDYRDKLIEYLKNKNISTAVHFVPLPLNKLYKKYSNNNKTKNAFQIWKKIVSLPFFPDLKDKEINYVIKCLKDFDKQQIRKL